MQYGIMACYFLNARYTYNFLMVHLPNACSTHLTQQTHLQWL